MGANSSNLSRQTAEPDKGSPDDAAGALERGSSDAKAFDIDELVDRCMGNLELAERLLAMFQDRFETDLTELEKVFETGESGEIARVAHRIKGASASVSAQRLQELAARIEQLGRSGQSAAILPYLEQLRREWTRCRDCATSLA